MLKEYDFSKAELIVPPKDPKKTRICIRIDTKTLNWFRQRVREAGGGNYQTMINYALKEFINRHNNKAEIMLTGLIRTTGIVSGTVTLSTRRVSTAAMGELLVHEGYVMEINKSYLAPKKEKDERKRYPLAA